MNKIKISTKSKYVAVVLLVIALMLQITYAILWLYLKFDAMYKLLQ